MKIAFAALSAGLLIGLQVSSARAENKMGYSFESEQAASTLTRAGGSLGMKVGPQQEINSGGMRFELLKVEGVNSGSPAAEAGFNVGDQIIAVDGKVFPNVKTFAEYVGSVQPGKKIEIDYMPPNAGPKEAQRVGVTVGERGKAKPAEKGADKSSGGLSTGQKVAIGIGAAAVFGCYETNCVSKLKEHFGTSNSSQPSRQQ